MAARRWCGCSSSDSSVQKRGKEQNKTTAIWLDKSQIWPLSLGGLWESALILGSENPLAMFISQPLTSPLTLVLTGQKIGVTMHPCSIFCTRWHRYSCGNPEMAAGMTHSSPTLLCGFLLKISIRQRKGKAVLFFHRKVDLQMWSGQTSWIESPASVLSTPEINYFCAKTTSQNLAQHTCSLALNKQLKSFGREAKLLYFPRGPKVTFFGHKILVRNFLNCSEFPIILWQKGWETMMTMTTMLMWLPQAENRQKLVKLQIRWTRTHTLRGHPRKDGRCLQNSREEIIAFLACADRKFGLAIIFSPQHPRFIIVGWLPEWSISQRRIQHHYGELYLSSLARTISMENLRTKKSSMKNSHERMHKGRAFSSNIYCNKMNENIFSPLSANLIHI